MRRQGGGIDKSQQGYTCQEKKRMGRPGHRGGEWKIAFHQGHKEECFALGVHYWEGSTWSGGQRKDEYIPDAGKRKVSTGISHYLGGTWLGAGGVITLKKRQGKKMGCHCTITTMWGEVE